MKRFCIVLFFHAFALSLLCLIVCSGCYSKRDKATIRLLTSERDSLEDVLFDRDSMVLAMNDYIGVIATSLDSIKTAEHIYSITRNVEGTPLSKDEIQENLDLLESVIKRQRSRIEDLDSMLMNTRDSVGYYRQLISYLYTQLDLKDESIRQMKEELEQKDKTIRNLTGRVNTIQRNLDQAEKKTKEQSETIEMQSTIMDLSQQLANTGYILIAKKKELQSMGILSKGLRKTINYKNIDPSKFQKLDMREITEIELSSSSASILSTMPSDSYSIENKSDGTIIKILDPGRFWSITTFLIIEI